MKSLSIIPIMFYCLSISAQVTADLKKSVPLWVEKNEQSNEVVLKWIEDPNATGYIISSLQGGVITNIDNVSGSVNEYALNSSGGNVDGEFHVRKTSSDGTIGAGTIKVGYELEPVLNRGRCLLAIDQNLLPDLSLEIDQLIMDISMDGWEVDSVQIPRSKSVGEVKSTFNNWFDSNYDLSQAVFLLGRIAVPYSGNSAYDGHGDHQGAWVADTYYADLNGNWTDVAINNSTPSRAANKNVPGDGKFDQSILPSELELELGRVDFHNLPAFHDDEIELTRKYLLKNHAFRTAQKTFPRRAIVENNFASFAEGFGQSGWRNYVPMFGAENVISGNYEEDLVNEAYLCSYACGPGSYTSAGGIGTTENLWVNKEIQTVFTFTFGSYFGDWDVSNNFLRSALASGDVLTNAWAGRPVWQSYQMAQGQHIGFCARNSQNASSFEFSLGFGANSAHMSLLGDPTLRLHAIAPPSNLTLNEDNGDVTLSWDASSDPEAQYVIYRKAGNDDWEIVASQIDEVSYIDACLMPQFAYTYLVKTLKLELSASGSYYNTSLGIQDAIFVDTNDNLQIFYIDNDGDGFGEDSSFIEACSMPAGYVDNLLDCDDANASINPNEIEIPYNGFDDDCNVATLDDDLDQDGFDNVEDCDDEDASINPDAMEIPNNGIDEDCDGMDGVSNLTDLDIEQIQIYPNPSNGEVYIFHENLIDFDIEIIDSNGQNIRNIKSANNVKVKNLSHGVYLIKFISLKSNQVVTKKLIVQ